MKVHFIAIGGTGMGATAGLMSEAGHEVRGSDGPLYPPMSTLLEDLKIPVAEGFDPANLSWQPDLVVVGNTCRADNVELVAARELGLRCVSFPQLLNEQYLQQREPIVVAGTHGKTTTTSLMAHVLAHAGRDPGFLIGGIAANFGRSFRGGSPPYFVIEGDEYDSASFDKRPKFVHYNPHTAILTGIEYDHADIYPDMAAIEAAFSMLVEQMRPDGRLIVYADSPVAMKLASQSRSAVETYRVAPASDEAAVQGAAVTWLGRYRGSDEGGVQKLTLLRDGEVWMTDALIPMTGAHNMANSVAVAAAAAGLSLTPDQIKAALRDFVGVKRRQEVRGVVNNITIIDDFAHHPTAVATTLDGLRNVHGPGRLVAVFEPRSGTSRRAVFQRQYIEALSHADWAIVAPVFAAEKLAPAERLDRDRLVADINAAGTPADGPEDVAAIIALLVEKCAAGDTVVVMSSGGFDGLIPRLLDALSERP